MDPNRKQPNIIWHAWAGLAGPCWVPKPGGSKKLSILGIKDMSYEVFGVALGTKDGANCHYYLFIYFFFPG